MSVCILIQPSLHPLPSCSFSSTSPSLSASSSKLFRYVILYKQRSYTIIRLCPYVSSPVSPPSSLFCSFSSPSPSLSASSSKLSRYAILYKQWSYTIIWLCPYVFSPVSPPYSLSCSFSSPSPSLSPSSSKLFRYFILYKQRRYTIIRFVFVLCSYRCSGGNFSIFLAAKLLYKYLYLSVRPYVHPSVRLSLRQV